MLPLSVSAPASLPTSTGDAPLGQPGDAAGSADFGALLTAQVAPPESSAAATPTLTQLGTAALAMPASPASLPESGKILPDALPLGAVVAVAPAEVPATAPTTEPVLATATAAALLTAAAPAEPEAAPTPDQPVPPLAISLVRPITRKADKADTAAATAPEAADAPEADQPEAAPLEANAPVPVVTALAMPVPTAAPSAQPAATAPEPATTRTAAPLPLTPQPAQPRSEVARTEAAQPQPQPQPQSLPVLALDRAAPPAAAVFTAAMPGEAPAPSLTARVRLSDAPALSNSETAFDTAPTAGDGLPIPLASPAAPMAAPVTTPTAPAANRPHDFAALVDSLVAAREAAQPQAVSIAVSHAEFGPVHLRFNHDQAGLSVSMASADPDFARAASLAMPPVQASVASSDAGSQNQTNSGQPQGQIAARQNGGSEAGAGFSQGQDRPASERAAEREVRANPSAPASRPDSASSVRAGIFA